MAGMITIVRGRARRLIPRDEIRAVKPGPNRNITITTIGMLPFELDTCDITDEQLEQVWEDLDQHVEIDVLWTVERKLSEITDQELRAIAMSTTSNPSPVFIKALVAEMVRQERWRLVDGKPHEYRDIWTREERR